MSRLEAYFADYATYHQTSGNQRTHALGIPLIMIAVLSWAARWIWVAGSGSVLPDSLFQLDFALFIIACATVWYIYLDWKMGLAFFPALLGIYWIARCVSPVWAGALFVLGWVLQLVGHAMYEKKSPAFTRNIEHLLIGPIWLFSKVLN